MNQEEIITLLRKQNILEQLMDGPVSTMVRQNGKLVPIAITRKGDWVIVTTGHFFKRRMRIALTQLEETGDSSFSL